MRKFSLLFFLLLGTYFSVAQSDTAKKEKHEHVVQKWKIMFGFDGRSSSVLGQKSKFSGLKLGIEYMEKHQFGVGLYNMKKAVILTNFNPPVHQFPDATDTSSFAFGYFTVFWEKIWFENNRWELSTPWHFGIGGVNVNYLSNTGKYQHFGEFGTFMTEISFVADYRVFRWFQLGIGGGHRWLLNNDRRAKEAFGGPVFILQFKVLMKELYKMTFKKDSLKPWK